MAGSTDMNIVLGQGSAIQEVYQVRKQSSELSQQFVAQQTEEKRKDNKSKVRKSEQSDLSGIKEEEERGQKGRGLYRKEAREESPDEDSPTPEGKIIDLKV